jgi:alkyl hydroperoxide reductase 1
MIVITAGPNTNIDLPGYIAKREELKTKGVDIVGLLAYNDAFVLNAWAKANEVTSEQIVSF